MIELISKHPFQKSISYWLVWCVCKWIPVLYETIFVFKNVLTITPSQKGLQALKLIHVFNTLSHTNKEMGQSSVYQFLDFFCLKTCYCNNIPYRDIQFIVCTFLRIHKNPPKSQPTNPPPKKKTAKITEKVVYLPIKMMIRCSLPTFRWLIVSRFRFSACVALRAISFETFHLYC